MRGAFDLCLAYPQWQGSGRSAHLLRGGLATAEVCAQFAPRVDVPIGGGAERAHGVNNWDAIVTQMRAARRILDDHAPRRIVTAGGDCSVDAPVIDYLSGVHPGLGVVWIDAHLDANTPSTSPSGNLHGMPVAAIMGAAAEALPGVLRRPLDPARFRYYGVRVGDPGEWAFKAAHGLAMLEPPHAIGGPVHIHFDLDVLDPMAFPHLAYPEPGGPSVDDAIGVVSAIAAQAEVVGLTITEFSPADEAGARAGQAVIARICAAALRWSIIRPAWFASWPSGRTKTLLNHGDGAPSSDRAITP